MDIDRTDNIYFRIFNPGYWLHRLFLLSEKHTMYYVYKQSTAASGKLEPPRLVLKVGDLNCTGTPAVVDCLI